MNLKQRDRKFFGGRPDREELQIVREEGSCVFDARGRRYLDFTSGWCVGNLGWGKDEIERAVKRFKGPTYVSPNWHYAPWIELAELLARIAPGKLTKSFRATGGSEAVELALQAAMLHTGRRKFLSFEDSYHGNTLGALSIGASETRGSLKNLLPGCGKVKPPLDARALVAIERRLRRREIAAFIMEPISINHGVIVPSIDDVEKLANVCRRAGTLLIFDEVACGFGRTGKIFASEHFRIGPDLLCLGKALTGGYGAMGALLATREVATSLEKDGNFYSTFGWHPRSVAAALASVRFLVRHQRRLLAHVAELSGLFAQRLSAMKLDGLKALRVQGLAIGLEFEAEAAARHLLEKCRRAGLLLADNSETELLLLPPLNLAPDTAERALRIIERAARR